MMYDSRKRYVFGGCSRMPTSKPTRNPLTMCFQSLRMLYLRSVASILSAISGVTTARGSVGGVAHSGSVCFAAAKAACVEIVAVAPERAGGSLCEAEAKMLAVGRL